MGNSLPSNDACGLSNLGNTCYMASVIQALTALRVVRAAVARKPNRALPDPGLDEAFRKLVQSMLTANFSYTSPFKFWKVLFSQDDYWNKDHQHDVLEFIDHLIEHTNVLTELFDGMLGTEHICTECHTSKHMPEPFRYLTLNCLGSVPNAAPERSSEGPSGPGEEFCGEDAAIIPEEEHDSAPVNTEALPLNSLARGFKNFRRATFIASGEDLYECTQPSCRARNVGVRRCSITRFPEVLVINLNRFVCNAQTGAYRKDTTAIEVDESLLFRTHINGEHYYRLSSAILHIGKNVASGHYVTIIRRGSRWFLIDDASVHLLGDGDLKAILHPQTIPPSSIQHPLKKNENLYVLFYQKVQHRSS